MDYHLLDAEEVRKALAPLSLKEIERLSVASGVPAPTIYKIRRGETQNPGIETVRQFWPHIRTLKSEAA